MGDFVRGRPESLAASYPERVVEGILSHRKVDVVTDAHPVFLRSRKRFSKTRRRVAGIIVDMVYDHFLATHWSLFEEQPLDEFIQEVYWMLEQHTDDMPENMRKVVPKMVKENWLGSYTSIEHIGYALNRISLRFKRSNPLAGAIDEVELQYHAIEQDFLEFFPQLLAHPETTPLPDQHR